MAFALTRAAQRLVVTAGRGVPAAAQAWSTRSFASEAKHEYLIVTKTGANDSVGLITLNRPKALNALCSPLMAELSTVLKDFQDDDDVGAVVITGSTKAFAAGADIVEMSTKTFAECYSTNFLSDWCDVASFRKPVIAAVNGFALGGGCELAMMCDIIYAGDTAVFGQPEIKLGTIPGAGGTQRLTHAIGKSKAMELCLTGGMLKAGEAEASGLVCRVYPKDDLVDEVVKQAEKMAAHSTPIVMMAKEAVNKAYELNLKEGLDYERRLFHQTFATHDREEGMKAFVEKRDANFKGH